MGSGSERYITTSLSGNTADQPLELEVGTINAVIISDIGNTRANNEDVGLFFTSDDQGISSEKGYLMLVADGMGGHKAGEVASRMAADVVSYEYFNLSGPPENSLVEAFELANKNIFERSISDRSLKGMGTTCTAIVIINNAVYYAHMGDSRAYFLKKGMMSRITEDHTYVHQLVKNGSITQEEAAMHPRRNVLTNAMGTNNSLQVDAGKLPFPFEHKDRLMICSDGLYEYLNDNEIRQALVEGSLRQTANKLVYEAKIRGGHDNITIAIAERIT